ncbi:MAG: hypothetical protein IPJ03_22325 [Ignavibacteriales bacterium]|nr:hypothetical protein [Ignavibacteriales bacterium]
MNDLEKLISFLERTRIEHRERWMVKDTLTKEWVVYQRKFRAKRLRNLREPKIWNMLYLCWNIKINYDHSCT